MHCLMLAFLRRVSIAGGPGRFLSGRVSTRCLAQPRFVPPLLERSYENEDQRAAWEGWQHAMEARYPCLFDLKMTVRSCRHVQSQYREKLRSIFFELLPAELQEQLEAAEESGLKVPHEELLCLLPEPIGAELLNLLAELTREARLAEAAAEELATLKKEEATQKQLDKDRRMRKLKKRHSRSSCSRTANDVHRQFEGKW
mmetsp:Transcript_9545/g.17068  ORF Transcript_9545/g.17068 Transcript_9545/m.17068 type:complete len:200 (+) Transcript_9545:87-686(+)